MVFYFTAPADPHFPPSHTCIHALNTHTAQHTTERTHMLHGACFLVRRILVIARGLPFSLCIGDAKANVESLIAEDEPPADHTAKKIWQLSDKRCKPLFSSDYFEDKLWQAKRYLLRSFSETRVGLRSRRSPAHSKLAQLPPLHAHPPALQSY